jgi:hypothetical protein
MPHASTHHPPAPESFHPVTGLELALRQQLKKLDGDTRHRVIDQIVHEAQAACGHDKIRMLPSKTVAICLRCGFLLR